MILAAGRGERMRPLTDSCPKPLLAVQGKPLMQWPMDALARAGVRDILINTAWLGEQIEAHFGQSLAVSTAGREAESDSTTVSLRYSNEGRDFGGALETAGGIIRALPQLADPFFLLAGDVFAPQFRFSDRVLRDFAGSDKLAHIWLVPNPTHNPNGDFALTPDGLAHNEGPARHTYSTIGMFRHALFAPPYCDVAAGNPLGVKAPLAPLLRQAAKLGLLGAQLYTGAWTDVGTPERLRQLNLQHAC